MLGSFWTFFPPFSFPRSPDVLMTVLRQGESIELGGLEFSSGDLVVEENVDLGVGSALGLWNPEVTIL